MHNQTVKTLHPKIAAFKRKSGYFMYSGALSIGQTGALEQRATVATSNASALLDKRIIPGYGCQWGVKDTYSTKFIKGCCAKSIKENGPGSGSREQIKSLWQHRQDDPLANQGLLVEDDYGLYQETMPLDEVPSAERCLTQIRSGTIAGLSIGFIPNWDRAEWDDADDSLVFMEIALKEISPVTFNSVPGSYIMRSAEDFDNLDAQFEEFIAGLPKANRIEARQLFTRYKSLINLDTPPEQRAEAPIEIIAPVGNGIDFQYLLNNFKTK